MIRWLLLGFASSMLGCSTLATVVGGQDPETFDCDDRYTITRVYSGVSNDLRFLRGGYQDGEVALWDLPFSFIADTALLPYTLYTQIRYGNLCDRGKDEDSTED